MAHLEPGCEQRRLEGERAPDEEADQVVAPERRRVLDFPRQRAVLEDPVAREVGAQVAARGALGFHAARIDHLQQWARPRIALAEEEEIEGVLARNRHQVRLRMGGREPGGRARPFAAADGATRLRCAPAAGIHVAIVLRRAH